MSGSSEKGGGGQHALRPLLSTLSSYFSPVTDSYDRFSRWRASLGLPCPGNIENMTKEAKTTHLTNYMFDGARADLTKALSIAPVFQVTHSFSLASQTSLPQYNFGAIFANNKIFMQGGVDHEGILNGRLNAGWSESSVTKVQMQLYPSRAVGNMVQLEHDHSGSDYSLNIKALNPSPVDSSGLFIAGYLQSITKNLALGTETLYQRGTLGMPPLSSSFVMKYTGDQKDWIATAHAQPAGVLQTTYWQRVNEKVEAAADLQVSVANGKREGIATLGAKYDLRMATFRAQVDSTGKVSALLEQRFAPTFTFMVAGEIDHFKNSAKVGIGVMIESSSLSPEEMGLAPQPYPPSPSYP